MTVKTAAQLVKLLQQRGYIKFISKDGGGVFANGPTGALLRQNVFRAWWARMVTKAESSFPVYGQNIDPIQFYPDILKLQSRNVPFSIAYTRQQAVQNNSDTEEMKPFLNSDEETCLNFNHFCQPASVNQIYDQVVNTRINWWKQYSCSASNFTVENVTQHDKSVTGLHIQYKFPSGPVTIETICNLGDENIKIIEEESQRRCKFHNGKKELLPCQIECKSTIEMAMAVFVNDAFTSDSDKMVLQLHPALAPFKVAMLRDGEKMSQVQEVTRYIGRELRKGGIQIIDTKDTYNATTEQIKRFDEIGVPFIVIVDDFTLETGAVKLRHRDTTIQETLAINKLVDYVTQHVTYEP